MSTQPLLPTEIPSWIRVRVTEGENFKDLKQMVRSLVGTLVKVGLGKLSPSDIKRILEAHDRRKAGQTAPAQGLSLLRIFYDVTENIPETLISSGSEFGFALGLPPQAGLV